MTINVSPERSTLSLPGLRLRPDGNGTLRAGPDGVTTRSEPQADRAPPGVSVSRTAVADAGALRAATSGLDRATSITDAALAASDTIIGLLDQLREAAGGEGRSSVALLLVRIDDAVKTAKFDGVNLLDGSVAGGTLRLPANADGSGELAISAPDLRPGGPVISIDPESSSAAAQAEASLARTEAAREALREDAKRVGAHRAFVGLLSDAVAAGSASLDVEGARLAALAVKQTLGGTSLAVSNGAPQTVLSLFR